MSELIDKLRTLNPTPGEWKRGPKKVHAWRAGKEGITDICASEGGLHLVEVVGWDTDNKEVWLTVPNPDDLALIESAPGMRLELLRMADELAALRARVAELAQVKPVALTYGDHPVGFREDESSTMHQLILFDLGPCVISLDIDEDDNDDYTWEVTDTVTGYSEHHASLEEALEDARRTAESYDDEADDIDEDAAE